MFNGLKGGMRFGAGDGMSHVIRLKPKAQMGLDIIGLSINLGLDITGLHNIYLHEMEKLEEKSN